MNKRDEKMDSDNEKVEELKRISLNEWNRRGCTGVFRFYYGKKYVVEWDGDNFDLFWELWKTQKKQLKELGFGVRKDMGRDRFIIFREIDFIRKELPETHPFAINK